MIILLFLMPFCACHSQNASCKLHLKKGIYYSVSEENFRDTTFHKISDRFFIGYSMKTTFYYKNKLTWGDSCFFRSEHFKNNSEMSHFKKGTGYKCRLLDVGDDYFRFSYYGEETGSQGVMTYYKYSGRIPRRYRRIKRLKHNPYE